MKVRIFLSICFLALVCCVTACDDKEKYPVITVTEGDRYLVNHIAFIPILVGAIQEQNAQIEALKAEVAALKSK